MRTTADGNSDTRANEAGKPPRPGADEQAGKSTRRFEAIFQARERHIREARATLERAGMTTFGDMVPEWSAACLTEHDSYKAAEDAYRQYRDAATPENQNHRACKASFEQVVFQFGLASEYCGRDPEIREAFAREVTRVFPVLSREDALALMRQFSSAAVDYARSMKPEQWQGSAYADFFKAARKLPRDYRARFLDIGFQLLRMIANGYFDISRQLNEMPMNGRFATRYFRMAA